MIIALHNSCPDARKSPHDERGLAFHVRSALHGAAGPFELDVQSRVERGSFVAIIGSSGAGKTTLLRLLAGLSPLTAGHVGMDAQVWCDTKAGILLPTYRRSIGFVFQDYALFPNMTVRGNVEYAMRSRDPDEIERLLQLVDLEALAGAYPERLSGGQMLDEPLSALDPLLRRQLQDELKRLHHTFGTTTLLISHDIPEILRLADRVIRLEHGKMVFDGSPAAAFGASDDSGDKLVISGEHIDGPDEHGISTVRINERLTRIRYRDRKISYAKGDVVFLEIDEAAASRPG